MDSILPDRLLALVRPGNDLVLRRIRNLKRCVEACGCKIMTPRYAVWQNAPQLPLFLQGEPPQRKPWLVFFADFWLAGFGFQKKGWLLAGFWLVFWLAFWLAPGWFGGWLSGWLQAGLAGFWLAFWLASGRLSFFPCFFSSPCRNAAAGHFASISRGHYFAATRLHAAF